MTDQTPDLAALEALAEAIDGEWACSHDEPSTHRPPDTYDVYLADGSAEVLANLPWELAAYIAAADPQTVLWLIREVRRLREPLDDLEIINGWLVQRGVWEVEYPAGVEYGPMPYSDAQPLVDLSTLSGWPDITRAEKAEAEVERLRESIAGSPEKARRLASLVASSTRLVQIERDDARARAEKAEATIERVRALAEGMTANRGALLAILDGGEPHA